MNQFSSSTFTDKKFDELDEFDEVSETLEYDDSMTELTFTNKN